MGSWSLGDKGNERPRAASLNAREMQTINLDNSKPFSATHPEVEAYDM